MRFGVSNFPEGGSTQSPWTPQNYLQPKNFQNGLRALHCVTTPVGLGQNILVTAFIFFGLECLELGLGMFRLFLNCSVLERGPSARSFRSRSFFQSFRSFTNHSNIFKNAFHFMNDGIVLDCSVHSRERTIVPQEQRPALIITFNTFKD